MICQLVLGQTLTDNGISSFVLVYFLPPENVTYNSCSSRNQIKAADSLNGCTNSAINMEMCISTRIGEFKPFPVLFLLLSAAEKLLATYYFFIVTKYFYQ